MTTTTIETFSGSACVDCVMIIAYDDECPHYAAHLWGTYNYGASDYQVLHAGRWHSIY